MNLFLNSRRPFLTAVTLLSAFMGPSPIALATEADEIVGSEKLEISCTGFGDSAYYGDVSLEGTLSSDAADNFSGSLQVDAYVPTGRVYKDSIDFSGYAERVGGSVVKISMKPQKEGWKEKIKGLELYNSQKRDRISVLVDADGFLYLTNCTFRVLQKEP